MTEFYGFSLDEFCELLKTKESSQVFFEPKNSQAAGRLKQALHLAGNTSTGIEEEYDIFVPVGDPEIISVEPEYIGQKMGLKPGAISIDQLTKSLTQAESSLGQQLGLTSSIKWEYGERVNPGGKRGYRQLRSLGKNYSKEFCEERIRDWKEKLERPNADDRRMAASRIAKLEEEIRDGEKAIAEAKLHEDEEDIRAQGVHLLKLEGYDSWPLESKLLSLLGVRVVRRYERKTKLSKAEFESIISKIKEQENPKDINGKVHVNDNNTDIQLYSRFDFAVPYWDFISIHRTIIQASGGRATGGWPTTTYQILKIRNGIKDLSFSVYRQRLGDTVVFYSGEQAVLVYEELTGDISLADLFTFITAHPEIAKAKKFTLNYFLYDGGLQLIGQCYVDAGQQQMVNLQSRTVYCQKGDVSRKIDVTSSPNEKLQEAAGKVLVANFLERFQWLNGDNAKSMAVAAAFSNCVTNGTVTSQETEAIQGGYLGLPIDSHGLTPIYGGWSVNHNMLLGCIGHNYHGHIYDLTDSEEVKKGNFLGYVFIYGEASLMTQTAEFSREYIKQADIQQKVQGEAYQKGQQRIQEELHRLRRQRD